LRRRRVELGFGVPLDGVPQADRFWLNAAPAIAALRLGFKDHPMVAMCRGVADQDEDYSDLSSADAAVSVNQAVTWGVLHGGPPMRCW
jgi:hypothetical protein